MQIEFIVPFAGCPVRINNQQIVLRQFTGEGVVLLFQLIRYFHSKHTLRCFQQLAGFPAYNVIPTEAFAYQLDCTLAADFVKQRREFITIIRPVRIGETDIYFLDAAFLHGLSVH